MSSFLCRLLGILFLTLIFCALMLPSLLSTHWGSQLAVNCVNCFIPGKVEIQSLNLSWGKGQVFDGVRLKNIDDQTVLNFERLSTEATLWQLLTKNSHIGATQIKNFNAKIVADERGMTNLEQALGFSDDQYFLYNSPSTTILSNVNADVYLFADQHPFSLQISGFTQQENVEGSFEVNLCLNDFKDEDWEKLTQDAQNFINIEKSKAANIKIKIVNFPVPLIDHLIASINPELKGILLSILGDRLNIRLEKITDDEELAFNIKTESPFMEGDVRAKVIDGTFQLREPAVFKFQLAPDSLKPFLSHQLELLEKTPFILTCQTFTFPLKEYTEASLFDPALLNFKAQLSLPKAEFNSSYLGKLKIQNSHAYLNSDHEIFSIKMIGSVEKDSEPFEIQFDSSFKKTNLLVDLMEQLRHSLQAELKITHLPIGLISSLHNHPEWIEEIGSHADIKLTFIPSQTQEWEGDLSLETSKIVLKNAKFHFGKAITLKSPVYLNWSGNSKSLNHLLNVDSLFIEEPFSVQIALLDFQLPLDNPKLVKFQMESTLSHLQFSQFSSKDYLKLNPLTIKIIGQNLETFHSEFKGQLALKTSNGTDSPLLLAPVQINHRSNWALNSDGKIVMNSGELQLFNSILLLKLEGRLKSNEEFEMTHPLQIQYNLTPKALYELNKILDKDWPKLEENANICLTINPIALKLNALNLTELKIQGMLSVDHFSIKDASGSVPFLKDLSIPWVLNGPMNTFHANVKGFASIHEESKSGDISGHFQLWSKPGFYDLAHSKVETHMNFSGMPTSILNMLLSTEDLSPILGPIIDLNFKTFIDPTNEKDGYWDLQLDGSNFHLNGRFQLEDSTSLFDTTKPPSFRLTLTPESYLYLKQLLSIKDDRVLESPFTLSGHLSQFYVPLKESTHDHSLIEFQFSSSEIKWQDDSIPSIRLEGKVDSENLLEQIHFFTRVYSSSSNHSLSIKGWLSHLFDINWKISDLKNISLNMNLQGKQITGEFFQSLCLIDRDRSQKMNVLFGESLEVNADCQLENFSGPLKVIAKGSNGEIHLDSEIVEGTMKLKSPLKGSLIVTPQLSQMFLSKNVPILKSALEAEKPVTFKIEPSEFSCPLFPFHLDQVKIGKGTLDFGKVHFQNEGELHSLLNFIHSFSDPYLTIWFTPLYFQMDHGKLSLKRIDMLVANTYSLASWGEVNLNQNIAKLIIGLSSQSLSYAFGIKGLDEEFVLQIPLHSANGSVEIDKKKATTRISSLIAQSKGGSTGKLLGNILDLALSDTGEVTVPPTTQPFPWAENFKTKAENKEPEKTEINHLKEELLSLKEDHLSKKKKKHKHRHDKEKNSFSEIQEGALQILDQLIGQ